MHRSYYNIGIFLFVCAPVLETQKARENCFVASSGPGSMSSSSIPNTSLPPKDDTDDSIPETEATLVLQIAERNGPSFLLLPNQENIIGRAVDADIVVADRLTSRGHAAISRNTLNGEWQIKDLQSRNGTWVDGQRITEISLQPEMSIRIGTTEFIFRIPSRRSVEETDDESEKIIRCEPVGEIEGYNFQRSRDGLVDEGRRTMLLYQTSIRLLASQSIEDVIAATVEIAAENTGADAVGWFDLHETNTLESVLVVPPSSDLTERLDETSCQKFIRDGHAVWVKRNFHNRNDGESTHAYGLMFIPVLDGERPWAALCATAENDHLQDNDFGFFVSLISLASAACAGHQKTTEAGDSKPAAALAGSDTVDATPEELQTMAFPNFQQISAKLRGSLRLDEWQRILITEALRRAEGRIPEAAEELGISRSTLYRKIEQSELNRETSIQDDPSIITQTDLRTL
jgi:hypothetical protein